MAGKKKSSMGKDRVTKSGFIRSLPDRTPAKEVIAKAKEAGLDLNEKFVWTVQSEMRSKGQGSGKKAAKKTSKTTSTPAVAAAASAIPTAPTKSKGKKGPKKKAPAKAVVKVAASAESASAEHKMKSLIVRLGTARADELYRSVRKELDALLSR